VTPVRIGLIRHMSSEYHLYATVGEPGSAWSMYFGLVKGAHDRPPYCAHSSTFSALMAEGINSRTPILSVGPIPVHKEKS
jgi:hypothetical protein